MNPLTSPWTRQGLSLLALTALFVPSYADQTNIEQVVITGTRTEKRIEDSPVSVDVITAAEINMVSRSTVADALNYIPGVTVRRSVKEGYNVYMQGFDGNRVLVLVDGMRLVAPTGASADLGQISALDIERIEVVRGATSVLYGSSAMGGVINIITKKSQQNSLKLSFEGGSYSGNAVENDEYRKQSDMVGKFVGKNWRAEVTYQNYDNPGFDYTDDPTIQDSGSLDKKFLNAGLQYSFTDFDASYHIQRFQENKYRETGPFPGEGNNYFLSDVDQFQHDLFIESFSNWHIKARFNTHEEHSGTRTGLRDTEIDNIDIDSQYSWDTGKINWVSGARYYAESMDQKKIDGFAEVDDVSRDGTEVFLQGDWIKNNNLELVFGARAQNDSSYGFHNSARVNAMYKHKFSSTSDLKWRSGFGQGYRVPTLKERFFFFDHSNLGYIVIGDENLRPETSLSFNSSLEFNKKLNANNHLRFEFNAHVSDADDFISTERDSIQSEDRGLDVSVYTNVNQARLSGADLSFEYQTPYHIYQINYSYLDARDKQTQARIEERPYHQIKANYRWSIPKLKTKFLLFAVYEQGQAHTQEITVTDNFVTANTTVDIAFSKNYSFKFGIENIFDVHRKDRLARNEFDPRPVSSRYVFAGFTYIIK